MRKPRLYRGTEPYIYVSFTENSKNRVWYMMHRLNRAGYRVCYDDGMDEESLRKSIEDCAVFVAITDGYYTDSEKHISEMVYAVKHGKKTVMIGDDFYEEFFEDTKLDPATVQVVETDYMDIPGVLEKIDMIDGIAACNSEKKTGIFKQDPESSHVDPLKNLFFVQQIVSDNEKLETYLRFNLVAMDVVDSIMSENIKKSIRELLIRIGKFESDKAKGIKNNATILRSLIEWANTNSEEETDAELAALKVRLKNNNYAEMLEDLDGAVDWHNRAVVLMTELINNHINTNSCLEEAIEGMYYNFATDYMMLNWVESREELRAKLSPRAFKN